MRYVAFVSFVIALCLASSLARAQAENSQEPGKPDIPEIQPFRSLYESGRQAAAAERDQKVKNLDYIYMLNLDKLRNGRAAAGDLDGALAAKAELDRLGAHQPTTDGQRKAMTPEVGKLRTAYEAALKGYHDEAARRDGALLQKLLADLEGLQARVTTTGDLDKALRIKAEKERIAAQGTAQPAPPPVPPAKDGGTLLADSEKGFSDTQGKNNWSYGYFVAPNPGGPYVNGEFKPFPQYRVSNRRGGWGGGPQWLVIGAAEQHPGAQDGRAFWAVRRWTNQSAGSAARYQVARITGDARRGQPQGDGSTLRIFVDGREVFTRLLGGDQPLAAKFDVTAPLHADSTVDFAVDPGPGTNTQYDAVVLTATIRR